jgi:hypothetical protein
MPTPTSGSSVRRSYIADRNLDGYHGAYLLRRDLKGEVEFATIMLFDITRAGPRLRRRGLRGRLRAARARAVLARFDQRSAHYDTLLRPHIV